jgi:hypothetical protein
MYYNGRIRTCCAGAILKNSFLTYLDHFCTGAGFALAQGLRFFVGEKNPHKKWGFYRFRLG